eukprot:COSAG02_NODE_173_length_31245_cov_413.548096_17_plen_216_part_00
MSVTRLAPCGPPPPSPLRSCGGGGRGARIHTQYLPLVFLEELAQPCQHPQHSHPPIVVERPRQWKRLYRVHFTSHVQHRAAPAPSTGSSSSTNTITAQQPPTTARKRCSLGSERSPRCPPSDPHVAAHEGRVQWRLAGPVPVCSPPAGRFAPWPSVTREAYLWLNRGACRRFGVSLISGLRPNRTRELFSSPIGPQFPVEIQDPKRRQAPRFRGQ